MTETQSRKELGKLRTERADRTRSCIVYQAHDETEDEALKRARVRERGIRQVILIRLFAPATSPWPQD